MANGISIGVGADTRAFAKGVQSGIVEPLEDAQDTLGDVAKAGDKAGDQLEHAFSDQQRATQEFGRDYERMSEQIRSASQRTSRSISSDADDFTHRTERGLEEVKESARTNAIQVGASFTGGFDQAAGGLQGFIAEFLAGFGPGGVIAGVAAAAGLGLIVNAVDQGTEAAQAQKQAVADLAGEYIDAGKSGKRAFSAVADAIQAMATSTDGSDVIITLQDAWQKAQDAGADYQQIIEGIASGSPAEIQRAIDAVKALDTAHADLSHTTTDYAGRTVSSNVDQIKSNQALQNSLERAKKVAEDAGRAQELAAKAGISDLQLKDDLIHQLEGAYDDAAAGSDYFNKKTGEFEVGPYLADLRKVRAELKKYKDDLAESDLSAEAKKFLESQGAEQAAAMLRGYKAATPKQRAELNEAWSTSGVQSAGSYEDALGKNLAKIKPKAPEIPAPHVPLADTKALDAQLRQPKYMRVIVDGYLRSGKQVF